MMGDDMRDETDLDYCPACGSELGGEFPVECPEHGPVNIQWWPSPWEETEELGEVDETFEESFEEFEEFFELLGIDLDEYLDDGADQEGPFEIEDLPGMDADDFKEEFGEEPEGGGVRDRINRLLRRDG